jgi:3-methylfumaryl-CoA hydratase
MTQNANVEADAQAERSDDRCVLPLVRRLAALLDCDPHALEEGEPLPRGWHVMLFNPDTRQSQLRADGAAGPGVTLPDVGLPRLMMGGKRTRYEGDIPIGAAVRRASRLASVTPKEGRSGRFVVVTVRHDIHVEEETRAAIVEEQDYIMREAAPEGGIRSAGAGGAVTPASPSAAAATAKRVVTPDEALLFRYSALTSNPHRIHYDHPYATQREGYPALVVNGGLPTLMLIELFKVQARCNPVSVSARNIAPLYCGRPITLHVRQAGAWRLWAEDDAGRLALEADIE